MTHSSKERDAVWELIKSGKYDQAFRECLTCAKRGSADAGVLLGWMYQTGTGTEKNLDEAKKWYESAKSDNPGQAEFYLGTIYRAQHDNVRGLEAFNNAARAGYAPAMYHLGRLYLFGDGVPRDEAVAFRYFEEAAKRGHLFARRNIAQHMMSGRAGILRIPYGILSMIAVLYRGVRVGWSDPHSDLTLRL